MFAESNYTYRPILTNSQKCRFGTARERGCFFTFGYPSEKFNVLARPLEGSYLVRCTIRLGEYTFAITREVLGPLLSDEKVPIETEYYLMEVRGDTTISVSFGGYLYFLSRQCMVFVYEFLTQPPPVINRDDDVIAAMLAPLPECPYVTDTSLVHITGDLSTVKHTLRHQTPHVAHINEVRSPIPTNKPKGDTMRPPRIREQLQALQNEMVPVLESEVCNKPHGCECGAKYHPEWPRFDRVCNRGSTCMFPYCWQAHPDGRPAVTRLYKLCPIESCKDSACMFIHPTATQGAFRPKFHARTNTTPMCMDGLKCSNINGGCRFSHTTRPIDCSVWVSSGGTCPRHLEGKCLYQHPPIRN